MEIYRSTVEGGAFVFIAQYDESMHQSLNALFWRVDNVSEHFDFDFAALPLCDLLSVICLIMDDYTMMDSLDLAILLTTGARDGLKRHLVQIQNDELEQKGDS